MRCGGPAGLVRGVMFALLAELLVVALVVLVVVAERAL